MNDKPENPPAWLPPAPCLFLDASGLAPVVGVWDGMTWRAFRKGAATTAETLFAIVESVLDDAGGMRLCDCAGFIFVEGPGSILGIRIAAMALRTWCVLPECVGKPIFSVGSFTLSAHLLLRARPQERVFSLLADSRQGWWNTAQVCRGCLLPALEEMRVIGLASLPEPRFLVSQRMPGRIPVDCLPFPKDLLEHDPAVLLVQGILRQTDAPDSANPPAEYVKWQPRRHYGTPA